MNLDNFANCKIWLETTDTANKDTASDEASDVQDGDTPLIGSWIDLEYHIGKWCAESCSKHGNYEYYSRSC